MKKEVFAIVLGSALVAFGFSGWQWHVDMRPEFMPGDETVYNLSGWAGWMVAERLEITIGAALMAWGMVKRWLH